MTNVFAFVGLLWLAWYLGRLLEVLWLVFVLAPARSISWHRWVYNYAQCFPDRKKALEDDPTMWWSITKSLFKMWPEMIMHDPHTMSYRKGECTWVGVNNWTLPDSEEKTHA